MSDFIIYNNSASQYGGGLVLNLLASIGSYTINDIQFYNNIAPVGGAIAF
jgi:hypothetical protein